MRGSGRSGIDPRRVATEYGRAEYDVPVKEKLERMATAYGLHTGWGSPWPENEVPAPQVSKTHGGQRAYAPLSPVFLSNHALRWHAPPRHSPRPPQAFNPRGGGGRSRGRIRSSCRSTWARAFACATSALAASPCCTTATTHTPTPDGRRCQPLRAAPFAPSWAG